MQIFMWICFFLYPAIAILSWYVVKEVNEDAWRNLAREPEKPEPKLKTSDEKRSFVVSALSAAKTGRNIIKTPSRFAASFTNPFAAIAIGTLALISAGFGALLVLELLGKDRVGIEMAFPLIIAMIYIVFPAFFVLRIPSYVFAENIGWLLVAPGARSIKIHRQCDQAKAAEVREDYEKAEMLYKAELTGKLKDDFFIHLGLGNMYEKTHRYSEAIQEWQMAIAGGLPPEKHFFTAMRISDILLKQKKAPEAIEVLEKAIKKYPKDAEVPNLQKRLQGLRQNVN